MNMKFVKRGHYTAEELRDIHSGTAQQMDYLNKHIESMEQTYERHMPSGDHMLDEYSENSK
ncbi:hypothetical protein [Oenococcus kitaharae]|uniref:Uncharacterized protein n=1 Tax=Oenococcus kitaharae DSM 17330 TaxID=1045004 RepID=G9WHZ5_9LACO|nr:hypothetical protein [Oenococcus kitaharae]EHN58880.1 hypothetical protein OKIT_0771 [Oenococcus kitaharae DSM 17330]MCV3296862.1 hypothetical protein [Oenococcus kitaharae]OEY81794.1 hypothetical protein NT96_08490 [Oenococcus kitaharae]OEY84025.1 hypothetical protein NT95_02550 [Oenococcus kitaharae]OEY85618.1 hypothetical protein NV75_03885 [Oenococcus kitaharae]